MCWALIMYGKLLYICVMLQSPNLIPMHVDDAKRFFYFMFPCPSLIKTFEALSAKYNF